MPLPQPSIQWPPADWHDVFQKYQEHAAWYSASPRELAHFYGGTVTMTERAPWWKFWNRAGRVTVEHQTRSQLHMPLAGDMASTNAALLFGESPAISIAEAHEDNAPQGATATEDRLQEILRISDVESRLNEAADTGAALGGVFLKVDWDRELVQAPILSVVQADMALPEFRYGILTAVTLWRLVEQEVDDGRYLRHVERHEPGMILHGLYRGSEDNLGVRVALEEHPETARLPDVVELPFPGLAIRYIPNMRPNRLFRGWAIGQSDYAGSEGMMDALDETWTSWVRDIRLGKARLLVPEEYLGRQSAGRFTFDLEQEVYTPLDIPPASEQGITENQFAIRVDEHERTARNLVEYIVGHAGYSRQTFGIGIEGSAESGTALRIRERRTLSTQQRKAKFWPSPLADLFEAMLAIDQQIFRRETQVFRPRVVLADSLTPDQSETATVIDLLNRAGALSTEIKVKMAHPDWDQPQVDAEVARIREEQGLALPDPMQTGVA